MATLAANNPTLADYLKSLDPDGNIAPVIEILNETNELLDDITFMEGNLPTGHRSVIRTGLPAPTWRKLYGGVQPTKGTVTQVTDNTGNLEAYAEVDKDLADLSSNTAAFRMQQASAHLEGMSQTLVDTIFYGDEAVYPERFTGLAPRFNDPSAENGENMIDAGGSGSDNASIWLVGWGPMSCFMFHPKGSQAGLQRTDKGQVTIEDVDGNGGRMEAYREHFKQQAGLCLPDWRYVVRIANVDKSALTKDASAGADILDLMTQAIELLPSNLANVRPVFYVPQKIRSVMRRQIVNKVAASTLQMGEVAGKKVVMFDDYPVRRCDALAGDEAAITF